MADPGNTIVDEIPLPDGANYLQTFGQSIYCAGGTIKRVDIRTKTTSVIAQSKALAASLSSISTDLSTCRQTSPVQERPTGGSIQP